MAKTEIKLLRGQGMPQGYAFVANNAGALGSCEPWVNTSAKQLWVDNVCINPHLAITAADGNYLSLAYDHDANSTNKEVKLNLSLDEAALASYVLGTGHDFLVKYGNGGASSDTVYDINGNADGFITIGAGLSYDPDTNTISNAITDSFLDGVTVVAGTDVPAADQEDITGYDSTHTYMKFVFNTAASGAETIYVDVTDFYDNVDTKTQISAGTLIGVALDNNSFTTGATNTYTISHSNVTRSDTTGTPATISNGGTMTVVTGVTSSDQGHVTAVETTVFTLPTSKSYDLTGDVNGTAVDGRQPEAQIKLTDDASSPTTDTVTIKHEAQTSNVGSMVMFKESTDNVIEMQITIIDGGTF